VVCLATPIVVDITERDPAYKALAKRVEAKRNSERSRVGAGSVAEPALAGAEAASAPAATRRGGGPAPAPRPGARPQRPRRK
jgi:preprotein translocase subunit SecF